MRVVLAYSGGLEGSAAIQWLATRHGAEVVTVTLDLGQDSGLEVAHDRALSLGARRAHVLDARELFAGQFIVPALRADALQAGGAPMAIALSRPVIAQRLVDIARIERADALAHTGLSKHSRLGRLLPALAPEIPVLSPADDWTLGPGDLEAFARAQGLEVPAADVVPGESNLWGRVLGPADLAGPSGSTRVRPVDQCPADPACVDIGFDGGAPSTLNGVALPMTEMMATLGMLAAAHGVGRVVRHGRTWEAPAAVLLHAAHTELVGRTISAEAALVSSAASAAYVDVIDRGLWFTPFRAALDAYFAELQSGADGHVRLRLLRGEYTTVPAGVMPAAGQSLLRVTSSPAQH